MDFAFYPPEFNSIRMYTGPGSGSLLAAAGSWDSLSAELSITADTCNSVLSALTTVNWRGPAAQAMSATAAPYMGWLYTAAELTQETAVQARAAAAAYEVAHALTIPPAAVAANRTQLAWLVATNFFGQNCAAIAATETQYCEYWAQDAAAMNGYATSAAATTQLPSFSTPKPTTNQSGLEAQNAAVTAANNSANGSSSASQTVSGAAQAASTVSVPQNPIIPADATLQDEILAAFAGINSTSKLEQLVEKVIGSENQLGILPDLGAVAEVPPALASAPQLASAASGVGGGAGLGDVSASLASAGRLGSMSVPASWAAPTSSPVTALSESSVPTLEGTGELARTGSGMTGIPGLPGVTGSRATGVVPRYGARLTVMARPPAAG